MRTGQTQVWESEFGKAYTDRNPQTTEEMDEHYRRTFGITRTSLNRAFLGDLDRDISILEVGANVGAQLTTLRNMGFHRLHGIELQAYAIQKAKQCASGIPYVQGSGLALPFADNAFDLVFTSGVLIHISPQDIGRAMDEIHRVSRRYIWGWEYCAEHYAEVQYHGRKDVLWKANFARLFLDRYPTIELIGERRVPYLENDNEDSMYLLEKKHRD